MQKRSSVFVFVPIYVECAARPGQGAHATPLGLGARELIAAHSLQASSSDAVPSEFPFWTWFIDNSCPQAKEK